MNLARPIAFVLALAALAPAARAQSLNQLGLDRLNADAQSLWQEEGLPLATQAAQTELQKLVGVPHAIDSKTNVTIIGVNSVTLDCPGAPGLTRCDGSGIAGRLPLSGAWHVTASVRVHAKGKILFVPFDQTFNVGVELKNFTATVGADLDSSDPSAPKIGRVHPPVVTFDLTVTSSNDLVRFLSWLTHDTVNGVGSAVAFVGAQYLAQKIGLAVASTPQVVGAGGPALANVTVNANLDTYVAKLEQQAHDTKMPFGTIFEMRYRDAYSGTWQASLDDPTFQPVPVDFESIGDSCCNTGEYLAGLCFRYAATHAPQALSDIREVIAATRTLMTMKGRPGDLNRLIMPMSAYHSPLGSDEYVVHFNGVDYLASDSISRDCYYGMFFGLSIAYDLVGDAALRNEIRLQVEMLADYLLANHWTWRKRDGSFGERWAGVLEQQYGWLLVAERVNPAKYAAICDAYKGFADLIWTGFWIAVMDPYYSYYKFELGGGAIHTVLRLENDPVRWQRVYQGLAIMRHFLGHHQNALHNGFYFAADASSKARLGAENGTLLTRYLQHARRKIVVDVSSDPTIQHMPYSIPIDPNVLYPGGSTQPTTIEIATSPIPIEKRIAEGFAWTQSPFELNPGFAAGPNPNAEGESNDFILPYWMARYYGAIAAPRPPPGPSPTTGATTSATATLTR